MPRRRFALWAASLAAVHTAASAVPTNNLFTRQSSCAPNFSRCGNANFPDYFCCPSGQICLALAGNTTLLCCPEGSDCQRIKPLPCDISLQDGETNPDAVVKTTALGGTLERCGTQCCPFGYSCRDGQCAMDQDQNPVPIQSNTANPSATSTSSARTGATSGAETTQTADPTSPAGDASTASSSPDEVGTSDGGPPVAIIAGSVAAGLVFLVLIAAAAFLLLRRRKQKKEEEKSRTPPKLSRSTSSFGNFISAPIMHDNAFRSDFSRASPPREAVEDPASVTAALIDSSANTPETRSTLAVPPPAARGRERLSGVAVVGYGEIQPSQYAQRYENSPFVDMPYVDHHGSGGGSLPRTPPRQDREPSSVSINVFADPNITPDRTPESNADRRYTNMTTFTQMLDKADLGGIARGESYLPYDPNNAQAPPMPRR
ncbi:hypothetical protein N658DRAFT_512901 [Parathielavia hyrcaniae]|uniref:Epidermal growth factor receptor-like transmembrane-juxtamembrane segment domain-containing protein n=1 Tax=Parathielavia hyrcaniae TaxID=113614 RepID=A0AAN6QE07_9PEZI|nr:hypothetical protein N658DRAFT_512901 [Parathielavia hyrcaniae]